MINHDNWTIIYTTNKIYEAEIVKEILTENNIECVSINKIDSAYLFGDIELYVLNEHVESAKKLIPDFGTK